MPARFFGVSTATGNSQRRASSDGPRPQESTLPKLFCKRIFDKPGKKPDLNRAQQATEVSSPRIRAEDDRFPRVQLHWRRLAQFLFLRQNLLAQARMEPFYATN